MQIEVNGVTYESIITDEFTCQGCIADDDALFCCDIEDEYGYCVGKGGSDII